MTSSSRCSRTYSSAGFSPHHQVATEGIASFSPSRRSQSAGRKPSSAPDSSRPLPSALAMTTLPARARIEQAGHAERRVAAQLERVAEVVVQAAQDHVHALEAAQRLEEDAVVAHRQVAAPRPAGSRGSAPGRRARSRFRCSGPGVSSTTCGARRPRRRQRRQRVAAGRGRSRARCCDAQVAEQLREDARDDQPVLQRVAGARRRLRAVGDHPPAAVGRARQVGGVDVQPDAAGRPDARGTATGSRAGRKPAPAAAGPREQPSARRRGRRARRSSSAARCATPAADLGPFGGRDDQRQRIELPRPVGAARVGVDVVGDAVLAGCAGRRIRGARASPPAPRASRCVEERPPVRRARCRPPSSISS